MPTSKKQKITNRENAKLSTGPKTNEGKAIASQNAVKHGMYANAVVIDSPELKENREEYDRLCTSLIDELQPQTLFQEYLVRKIANCLWRAQRAIFAESSQIKSQLGDIDQHLDQKLRLKQILEIDYDDDDEKLIRQCLIGIRSIPDSGASMNILRYELRLDRQLSRAHRLLRYLQQVQRQPGPPPELKHYKDIADSASTDEKDPAEIE